MFYFDFVCNNASKSQIVSRPYPVLFAYLLLCIQFENIYESTDLKGINPINNIVQGPPPGYSKEKAPPPHKKGFMCNPKYNLTQSYEDYFI